MIYCTWTVIVLDITAYTRNPVFIVFRMPRVKVQTTTITTFPILFSNLILIFTSRLGPFFVVFLFAFSVCLFFFVAALASSAFVFPVFVFHDWCFFSLDSYASLDVSTKYLSEVFARLLVFGATTGWCRISLSPLHMFSMSFACFHFFWSWRHWVVDFFYCTHPAN